MSTANTTIYVGNLSFSTETATVGEYFQKFGKIKTARIITMRYRGERRSRGFGFVEFENEDGFKAALANTEPITIDNRKIRIVEAREKRKSKTGFLGRLQPDITEEAIKAAFKDYKIGEFRLKESRNKEIKTKFCFLEFDAPDLLTEALKVREFEINGNKYRLSIARPPIRNFRSIRRPRRRNFGKGRAPKKTATTPAPAKE